MELNEILATLRAAGGDTTAIEVKSAAGGLPESTTATLSAFANLPGGGVLVLGLDESDDFRPVGLTNAQAIKQGLGSRARAFTPPVRLDITDNQVEGKPVVIAAVAECDPSSKPCHVTSTGKAYLRSYDGDYELSALERQAFLTARSAPLHDRQVVTGTSPDDLDPDLVTAWTASLATRGRQGLGRFLDDRPELLRRAGVVTSTDELTLAGLLTLGVYPQQYLPRMVVQVAAESDRPGERARNAAAIDGPIPVMLDSTMDWLRANIGSATRATPSGRVYEVPDYPLIALRELVANALVHRDLAPWAQGQAIEVRLSRSKLVIANPGGLYGITVNRLGREHVTSARNPVLVALCQNARSMQGGERIIEALATGLPIVTEELDRAGLPQARYFDAGIRFTAMLTNAQERQPAVRQQVSLPDNQLRPGSNLALVFQAIRQSPGQTIRELAATTGLPTSQTRYATRELRTRRLILTDGKPGQTSRYRPADHQP